jgi:hypothetical protein
MIPIQLSKNRRFLRTHPCELGFPSGRTCMALPYVTPRTTCLEECRGRRLHEPHLESQALWSNLYGGVGAEGTSCRCDAV